MNKMFLAWMLVSISSYTMQYPTELIKRDKILNDMYETYQHPDVVINVDNRQEGNNPPIPLTPQNNSFKEKSKKYALYGTVAISVLTATTTLIVQFTTKCDI